LNPDTVTVRVSDYNYNLNRFKHHFYKKKIGTISAQIKTIGQFGLK